MSENKIKHRKIYILITFIVSWTIVASFTGIAQPHLYKSLKSNILDTAELEDVIVVDYVSYANNGTSGLKNVSASEISSHYLAEVKETPNKFAPGTAAPEWFGNNQGKVYSGPKYVSSCVNCTYYPVGKSYALSANYTPEVVDTGLTGGGKLTIETKTALTKFFIDAKTKGFNPKVNSAYRSYQTQLTTFNSWVEKEIKRGRSREEAELVANRYSARPGHSEHQLGTTADVACDGCSAFDKSSSGNGALWEYMQENAHKFGFVISYPPDKESITGYVYEPWHIRFIGVKLATELYKQKYLDSNNNHTLENFLIEKNLF